MLLSDNAAKITKRAATLFVFILLCISFVSAKKGGSSSLGGSGSSSSGSNDGLSGTEKYVPGPPTATFASNSFYISLCEGSRSNDVVFIEGAMFFCSDIAEFCNCGPYNSPSVFGARACTGDDYTFMADGRPIQCDYIHERVVYSVVKSGLSLGAIIGIAVGVFVAVLGLAYFSFRFYRARKSRVTEKS
ncbi:hypothetical protein BJ742DRAFT_157103 [Cladochytrium replicatum]|nr:hypothetical protein BJ742DRAFT_157103 [Cladochytrium replicatum]